MSWLFGNKDHTEINRRIEAEQEQTRQEKGNLASALVELDNKRYALDEMVRRALLEVNRGKPHA